jgi:hypothetical protein
MIIWNGLGFLVAVIVFGFALACNLAFDAVWGKGFYEAHLWTVGMAMFLSAPVTWALHLWFGRRTDRIVIDKETGEEFTVARTDNSLFFIPVRYWTPLLVGLGVLLCALEFL